MSPFKTTSSFGKFACILGLTMFSTTIATGQGVWGVADAWGTPGATAHGLVETRSYFLEGMLHVDGTMAFNGGAGTGASDTAWGIAQAEMFLFLPQTGGGNIEVHGSHSYGAGVRMDLNW